MKTVCTTIVSLLTVAGLLGGCGNDDAPEKEENLKSVAEEVGDVGEAMSADRKALEARLDELGEKIDARLDTLGEDAKVSTEAALSSLATRIDELERRLAETSGEMVSELSATVDKIESDVEAALADDGPDDQ